jgi:D-alanyl-D-alanine carboxypeptidase (penicillin-binding protein 5/6)
MNQKAQELGMKETTFHSVHGLPPGAGQSEDLASAYDLAVLGRTIVTRFPKLLEYASTEEAPIRDGTFVMHNVNKMLGRFKGLDGIKTGYYNRAGFCITSTAKRGDTRYIAVVMGCDRSTVRFNEAARLLNMGFNMFECPRLAKKDDLYSRTLPVVNGTKKEVGLVCTDDVVPLLKRLETNKVQVREQFSAQQLEAPVKAGTKVGRVTFTLDDKELGGTDLLTAEDIGKVGLLKRIGNKLGL